MSSQTGSSVPIQDEEPPIIPARRDSLGKAHLTSAIIERYT